MAMLAVGYGTLAAGTSAIGASAALDIDVVLWTVGALYGLATAVGVPYLLITRREASNADPTWLLPIVPPMVAAALGPVVAAHLPAGPDRETLLFACYAMFGASLMATLVVLPGIWRRLVQDKLDSLTMTPTLFLVLGPLGQSVTAAYQISHVAGTGDQYAILYGVPVMGFALLWLVLAGIANVRALRRGMPFAMTWWAYTFPVGTCVTGAIGLARLTGLDAFTGLSFALYVLLVVAWAVAGGRTLAGTVSGRLLRPAVPVMD
jgi:tellurite resistance protein TehA-like permease